ncbi:hypothetical protein ACVL91_000454 [Bradyrhizobium elkanii]|uniref:GNAT family N-acetyltransferase n=1 Tax=Bradyrhizobium elkanii TaxID=29448 RepID=A0A8I1YCG9_BRAEL|nr:GNAT family N-acetyltransferase [Bradyrhizobium elkanii]MBP1297227.1 hypothetical protein [Bradyrhizobium elkanii]
MTNSGLSIRRLTPADTDAAAGVHRAAFDETLPWLAGPRTPDEDRWFYREQMFATCTLWGGVRRRGDERRDRIPRRLDRAALRAAGRTGPRHRRRAARDRKTRTGCSSGRFSATPARRFYETRGFVADEETDVIGNEEREPGVRYRWTRGPAGE